MENINIPLTIDFKIKFRCKFVTHRNIGSIRIKGKGKNIINKLPKMRSCLKYKQKIRKKQSKITRKR